MPTIERQDIVGNAMMFLAAGVVCSAIGVWGERGVGAVLVFGIALICCGAMAINSYVLTQERSCLKGVRLTEEGFEIWRHLRVPVHIAYDDIQAISISSRGHDDFEFTFQTQATRASISEDDAIFSGLLDRVRALPGYDSAEEQRAFAFETDKWLVRARQFEVYHRVPGLSDEALASCEAVTWR